MTIDMHCHSKITKKADFSIVHFRKLVQCALRNRLDYLILTEHYNTLAFHDIYDSLDEHYTYDGFYYNAEGLRVIPGTEVDIKEGGHIILFGALEDVLAFRASFPERIVKSDHLSFDELMERRVKHKLYATGAHPFRNGKQIGLNLSDQQLKKLDFLELNAKDYLKEKEMVGLAERLDMSIVGGSDTHYPLQIGTVRNVVKENPKSLTHLVEILKRREHEIILADNIYIKNTFTKYLKKTIKMLKGI